MLLLAVLKTPVKQKTGSLTMKEMRLRLSPLKTGSDLKRPPFGQAEESDPDDASLYQEPFRLITEASPASVAAADYHKLVKNYSCGRLCDYDDFGALNPALSNKFGSTPLFNLPNGAGSGPADRLRKQQPTTSKSFTNNLYEKDYRKPCFESGYSIPVAKSRQSLARGISTAENFYAATDIIKVFTYKAIKITMATTRLRDYTSRPGQIRLALSVCLS